MHQNIIFFPPKLQKNSSIIKKFFNFIICFKIIDRWLKSPNIWTKYFHTKSLRNHRPEIQSKEHISGFLFSSNIQAGRSSKDFTQFRRARKPSFYSKGHRCILAFKLPFGYFDPDPCVFLNISATPSRNLCSSKRITDILLLTHHYSRRISVLQVI